MASALEIAQEVEGALRPIHLTDFVLGAGETQCRSFRSPIKLMELTSDVGKVTCPDCRRHIENW